MRLAGAVDIGGTNTKVGVVAEDGRILRRTTVPTNRNDPEALVDDIVATLRPLLDTMSGERSHVIAVGISVAGFLDREHTMMTTNANLPALCGFPLRRACEEQLERPVRLEVDCNAAAVAEYRHGRGRDASRLLCITIGTGLGGGVIINGRLLRFNGECVGDVGHIVIDPEGRQCTCGARGCLEAMVCSSAISERAGDRDTREIIISARGGDSAAAAAIAETGRLLGLGLASLSPIFAPDQIVVGGGIATAGDLLIEPTRRSYEASVANDFKGKCAIDGSRFEGWEGIVGAASLAFAPLD
jgi:glucokinase